MKESPIERLTQNGVNTLTTRTRKKVVSECISWHVWIISQIQDEIWFKVKYICRMWVDIMYLTDPPPTNEVDWTLQLVNCNYFLNRSYHMSPNLKITLITLISKQPLHSGKTRGSLFHTINRSTVPRWTYTNVSFRLLSYQRHPHQFCLFVIRISPF